MVPELLSKEQTDTNGLAGKWDRAETVLAGGKTNDLRISEDDTVLKRYSAWNIWALIQTGARLLDRRLPMGNVPLPRVDQRIYNEYAFRDEYEGEIDIPDILERDGDILEIELVEGVDLPDYLEENPDEAGEYGRKVAAFVVENHLENRAFTDLRTRNFLVKSSDRRLAFVDAESVTFRASSWDKKMDIITCFSSMRQTDIYEEFVAGFQQEYRGHNDELDNVLEWVPNRPIADITSMFHAASDGDTERLKKAFKNKVTPEVLHHYTLRELQVAGKEKLYERITSWRS